MGIHEKGEGEGKASEEEEAAPGVGPEGCSPTGQAPGVITLSGTIKCHKTRFMAHKTISRKSSHSSQTAFSKDSVVCKC